ncbi:Arm DNA-binding domain-containing protein [Thiocapsa imhoffii]|nr:DUF3596 domain-containing protein [Thiocapsa imhoffii]
MAAFAASTEPGFEEEQPMSSIRVNPRSRQLFFDFRYRGERCREYTSLPDTPANRKKLQKVLDRMDLEMATGTFEYRRYFPSSAMAARFDTPAVPTAAPSRATPLFRDFAEIWFAERQIEWRQSYQETVRISLDKHLLPAFGATPVGSIDKVDYRPKIPFENRLDFWPPKLF